MPDFRTAIDYPRHMIHPILDDIQNTTTRPVVRGPDWFSLSAVERLEHFGPSDAVYETHPALRGAINDTDAQASPIKHEYRLSSHVSEPLLRKKSDLSLGETFKTLLLDFAQRRDETRAYIASKDASSVPTPKIQRSKSVSRVINSDARHSSGMSVTGNMTNDSTADSSKQQASVRARLRKRFSRVDAQGESIGLPTRNRSIRWKSVSNNNVGFKAALENSIASRQRPALMDLSPNVTFSHDGLRDRAKQRVSSISKKLKKTVEIWRGDIEL